MFAQFLARLLSQKVRKLAPIALCITAAVLGQAATVNIQPGDDIPSIVAANPPGTTFVIAPGTYRLTAHIVPQTGDSFIGQTVCAPPTTSCPAILTGSQIIGPLATFDGTNYEVTGQTQRGAVADPSTVCQPGYLACNLPEDLFFDGKPYQHLYATSLPTIGPGQWWFDYTNHIIYFHDNPAGHDVETSVLDTVFDSTANNVTIQYLTIEGFATPLDRGAVEPTIGWNASPSTSVNWVVSNCEFYNNHGAGVRIAFGTSVLNNYIHDNGQIGTGGSTNSILPSGVVVHGNTITNNNYARVDQGHGAGGIKFGYVADVLVRGNAISDNDGAGIHFDSESASPLVDGNVVANNNGNGFEYEISLTSAVVRNNLFLENGTPDFVPAATSQLASYASVGVSAYCNVIEIPNINNASGASANGIMVVAAGRGFNPLPPHEYLASTGNSFRYNTVIWDAGATGTVGYFQADEVHQPNFLADNGEPDYNSYHAPSLTATNFVYGSDQNKHLTFAEYQAAGADVHSAADTNNTSGYPTVSITSPPDGSTFTGSVTIKSTASDKSGISKVEFFVDWNLQTTVTTTPYNFTWSNAPTGSHTVAAMAYSNAGISACYAITLQSQ
jgi:hypothetical protein